MLAAALFIGATFPFAVRVLAGSAADAGPASARVFAWNICGSIAGAVGTGFVLLPGHLLFASSIREDALMSPGHRGRGDGKTLTGAQ